MYDDWYKDGITAELLSVPSRLVVLGRLAERSQLGDRRGLGGLGHSGSNDEGVAWVEGERRVGQEGRLGGSNGNGGGGSGGGGCGGQRGGRARSYRGRDTGEGAGRSGGVEAEATVGVEDVGVLGVVEHDVLGDGGGGEVREHVRGRQRVGDGGLDVGTEAGYGSEGRSDAYLLPGRGRSGGGSPRGGTRRVGGSRSTGGRRSGPYRRRRARRRALGRRRGGRSTA